MVSQKKTTGRRRKMTGRPRMTKSRALNLLLVALVCVTLLMALWMFGALPGPSSSSLSLSPLRNKSASSNNNDDTFIHVVLSRFMQEQPNLVKLGMARLLLFQYICLPTMINQTSQKFIWIIQTDPKLDRALLDPMIALLEPYPNILLVGSNMNVLETQGGFRNALPALIKAPLFAGERRKLKEAQNRIKIMPLLQTRLDADDGLHLGYLEYLQSQLPNAMKQDFHFWCIKRLVEWHPESNQLEPVEHSKLCVTPGLTVAVLPNKAAVVPEYSHDVLYKSLQKDDNCKHCIDMISKFQIAAIRARTWTSAGMMDIDLESSRFEQSKLWKMVGTFFSIKDTATPTEYLKTHQLEIAKDNLQGQCTNGHSCKLKSLERLQRMVDLLSIGSMAA